jgi:hypothetical protein
MNYAKVNAQRS